MKISEKNLKRLKVATILLVTAALGPEIYLALEFIALIETIGVLAFWSSIWVGFKMFFALVWLNPFVASFLNMIPISLFPVGTS
ncbi:hypothetical protein MLD52_19780 [Puniceicoccaceae bacterium K14]|nr:hypothetical protein [Puniceicoccaceae bacterium K14]